MEAPIVSNYDIERSWAIEPLFYRAPHPEQRTPYDFQHAAVEYALSRRNTLIGDMMGLGKTAESLLISNAIEAERTLVVCPASLRLNWQREVWAWSNITNVSTSPIIKASDGVSPDHNYVILSYDLLRREEIISAILEQLWDHVILDEAHYFKDPRGNARSDAVARLPAKAGRITMLSGSIMPNQPIECLNAMKLLDWDAIDRMSEESFRAYYYDIGEGFVTGKYQKRDPKTGEMYWTHGAHWSDNVRNVPRNLPELRHRMRSSVMIRRLKAHVMPQLPQKQWHPFPLIPDSKMRKALKHPGWGTVERLMELGADAFNPAAPVDGEVQTAWRELGEAKAPAVADYCEELVRQGARKVIIAAWHRSVLAILRDKLALYGVTYMDGTTSATARQDAVDRFQEDDEITFIVGQLQTIGTGWTLTVAQDAVLAQPHPSPGQNDQFFDRIHRIGQEGDYTICHVPVVPDSTDERWISLAIRKDATIHEVLDVRD
jgi:SNF2 family DNA or RNA helicase